MDTTPLPLVIPGTDAPLAAGELVVFRDRKKRRYLVELTAGTQWHSHSGMLEHNAVIGQPEGTTARTVKNMEIVVMRPTREDYVLKMKRGAQVIYPKDQAAILAAADVRAGCTVIEAGAGSGALTLALLDAVGPDGTVISVERRDDHLVHARRNVERFHGGHPENWDVRVGDVADVLPDVKVHRVIFDLLEPWLHVDGAAQALSPGGIVLAYTPSVPQVMNFHEALKAHGCFTPAQTNETLVRGWDVDGLAVRPAHRMVAHTAFLTVSRRTAAARPIPADPDLEAAEPGTVDGGA